VVRAEREELRLQLSRGFGRDDHDRGRDVGGSCAQIVQQVAAVTVAQGDVDDRERNRLRYDHLARGVQRRDHVDLA
jgi:hypothetical protein